MSGGYVLTIDQSTSGTKALLFGPRGERVSRYDLPHQQKISEMGFVSHDPMEIYQNTLLSVRRTVEASGIDPAEIVLLSITNQRETALVWDRETGLPVADAVVWQCSRGAPICERLAVQAQHVRRKTGLNLSPYFSAAKIAWLLENTPALEGKRLCAGTMDSWLVFKLTHGESFKTDYSNASRTQLFNLYELNWDEELCRWFGIEPSVLPQLCDSDAVWGYTDLEGTLPRPVPIRGVMGDSHGALFGQACLQKGMVKATYGTGSSVMMNVGEQPVVSGKGLVTSIAWRMGGKVQYVLEGNINYTGAVLKWLEENVGLVSSAAEMESLLEQADPEDTTYLIPAFTGLGAPYWNERARAMLCGMTRGTGKAEIVKAAVECIAYQIADIVRLMQQETGIEIQELRVDGGPTRNRYLMQFQSDLLNIPLAVPSVEELSAMGAAYAGGIAAGIYDKGIFAGTGRSRFAPRMSKEARAIRINGWKDAVQMLLHDRA